MDSVLADKIAKCPVPVREYIKRLQNQADPYNAEIARLRQKVELLDRLSKKQSAQIEAMVNFFQCAAKGEHEVAKAVQRIVEDFLVSDEE